MNSAPSNSFSRPLALAFGLMIAAAALLWFRPASNPNVSHGAQLFLNTPELEPTTTFEVRFDDEIVGPDTVGTVTTNSPLVITPALPGEFTWLSRRSGVFTPSQSPALATSYRVALRAGLTNAAGEPLRAELSRVLATPPFEFSMRPQWSAWEGNTTNASAQPEFLLTFNESVSTNTARAFMRFVSAEGKVIAADATHPDRYYYYGGNASRPWHARFPRQQPAAASPDRDTAQSCILIVAPAQPLPVGKGWKFVVERGIPSDGGTFTTSKRGEFTIGNVIPLAVKCDAENELNHRKHLTLRFNKPLDYDALTNDLPRWFTISPPVTNFMPALKSSWEQEIEITGEFALGTNYALTIRAGFPAAQGFTLTSPVTNAFAFEPIAARAYLPAFSAEQLSGGRRAFEFLSVNCSNLTLTVKRIEPANLVHALRGYRSYGSSARNKTPAPLDLNVVPGETVFTTNFPGKPPLDEAINHEFDWTTLLGGRTHGTALVETENDLAGEYSFRRSNVVAQTLVQLTDLGLFWKRGGGETFVWCFSYANGQPVSGANVALLTDENVTLAEARTDAGGLARFGATTNANATWVRAVKGDDAHAVELGHNILSTWSWRWEQRWSWDTEWSDTANRTLLFSEREVYSPGDTVFAKAIARRLAAGKLELPEAKPLRLRCVDSHGSACFTTNVAWSALGSLDAAIRLPGAPLGEYNLELTETNGAHLAHATFQVAEFKPNAFLVQLSPKPTFAPGERIEFPLAARYYFGKPLASARVRWRMNAYDDPFNPAGFDSFTFPGSYSPRDNETRPSDAESADEEQSLDKSGKAVFTVDTTCNKRFPQPRHIGVNVAVTDQNQQTITESDSSVLHASDYYLGARLKDDFVRSNEPVELSVIAVNSDGKPREAGISVHASLKKISYRSVRMEGAGVSTSFRNEREETLVTERDLAALPVRNLGTRFDVAPDVEPARFTPTEPGEYIIELRAKDSAGRDVLTVMPFSVSAEAAASFAYRDDVRLDLVPNQPNYHAGDTARIMVKTPLSGPALVTVERNKVLRSFNVELSGNAPAIEVPLTDEDAPNVFVSVTILRGADKNPHTSKLPEYRYGYCQLLVESRATKLDVAVTAAQKDYRPGETVEATVAVKDGFDAPVANAEVTLYAVDEGILSLTGYKRPAPHELFLKPHPLGITSGISIPRLLPENPEELHFRNKGFVIGGGGVEDVRKNFAACAFWAASLRTDANGKVTTSFKAPDNLTRFRVIAVAHTARQFGGGESGFNINKPVMIEPALPRFANVGDIVTLRAVVHNKSQRGGEVRVELALDEHAVSLSPSDRSAAVPAAAGGETDKPGGSSTNALSDSTVLRLGQPRSITLAPNASGFVEFPVRFIEPGTAKWTWRAKMVDPDAKPFTDAVESKLEVGWPQPLLRETHLARGTATPVNLLADVNPQLLEGRGTIRVRIANSRLVELSESVAHLLHYPYGCAEQTSSALLPWLLLDEFPEVVPPQRDMNRETATQTGINRLIAMQQSNGGLAYWPGGESTPWASAYGGFVLALAPHHKVPVATNVLQRLGDYLRESLKDSESQHGDAALGERCLTLLALAELGRSEHSYLEVMFAKRDELSAESRALLALAILKSNGSESMAAQLLDEPPSHRAQTETLFHCSERKLALRLAAFCHLRPRDPAVDKLVAELMKSQQDGRWATTQGNAWALFALTEYARLVEGTAGPATGALVFNGESKPVRLEKLHATAEFDFNITPGTTPSLRLESGEGRLFTSMTIETRSALKALPRQDRGFGVTRKYELLSAEGKPVAFTNAAVGDSVLVTLNLDVHQYSQFVAVDDALPSVFEALNPAFKTEQSADAALAQDWVSDFKQLKTDRVQFFRDHLPAGQYVVRYLARVRAAGGATAPGAKVEEMYHPERFGFSGTSRVATKAME